MKNNRSFQKTTDSHATMSNERRQWGLTMIELLVALVLSSLIALAAVSSLIVARRGFSTADASSQLRDNSRYATDLIQRIVAQAGYINLTDALNAKTALVATFSGTSTPPPFIFGFNNSILVGSSISPTPMDNIQDNRNSTTGGCASTIDTACVNGSDVLVVGYQIPKSYDFEKPSGTYIPDKTMINCAGIAQVRDPMNSTDLVLSAFHVALSNGEPSLMCSYQDKTGTWQTAAQPIIQGVESFQVLYGVDGVTAGTATPTTTIPLNIANRYLRADQMIVVSNANETANNWRRVRSVRIGMVLRGPPNSGQDKDPEQKFYPLGMAMKSASESDDKGSTFQPAADGRLRQTMTFTVYLRNEQNL